MVALAGDDERRLFGELAALGYGVMIVYDNRGFLVGTVAPGDGARLADLMAEARRRRTATTTT